MIVSERIKAAYGRKTEDLLDEAQAALVVLSSRTGKRAVIDPHYLTNRLLTALDELRSLKEIDRMISEEQG